MTLRAPDPNLRAVVVVPAHNEEQRIEECVAALKSQLSVSPDAYEVVLVLDRCTDGTRSRALARAGDELRLHVVESPEPGAGPARRTGMELACARLLALGRSRGLIATTDADSVVAPDWLSTQLELVDQGAQAIGGELELDPAEAATLPADALAQRSARAPARLKALIDRASAAHHYFSGASLSLTVETYRRVGGMPGPAALEDERLQRVLESSGVPILRPRSVRVRTSARTDGRAERGLASDLRLSAWRARRSFAAGEFSLDELVARKSRTVSVIVPAREVARTIGPIVRAIEELRRGQLVDELVVIDADSNDGTAAQAAAAGATVHQESKILTAFGPARGKGDAMWRGLAVTSGELVVYLDGDTEAFDPRFVVGLLGPLITVPEVSYVKGAFRRPLRIGGETRPNEGGRVTELLARPLLNLYAPELAGFDQPLAGELAGRRELLTSIPFNAGYGVEIAMLIDALRTVGLEALAQVDLGERQNRHQPLRELSAMAYAVMAAAASRLQPLGSAVTPGPLALPPLTSGGPMEIRQVIVDERPPLRTIARGDSPARRLRASPGS